MSRRRLILIAASLALLSGLGLFLFGIGAGRRLLDQLAARVESRFGVDIAYGSFSSSLSGVTVKKVAISPRGSKALFAAIEKVEISLQPGQIFRGAIDPSQVRIDGLKLLAGSEVGGANLAQWVRLMKSFRSKVPTGGAPPKAPAPSEIQITSGKLIVGGHRFTLSVEGLSGRIGSDRETALKTGAFALSHAGGAAARGGGAEIRYTPGSRALALRIMKPRFEAPAAGKPLLDAIGDLFAALGGWRATRQDVDARAETELPEIADFKITVADATGSIFDPADRKKAVALEKVMVNMGLAEDRTPTLRASGSLQGASNPFTAGARISGGGQIDITLEMPPVPLAGIGALIGGQGRIDWSRAVANGAVTATIADQGRKLSFSGQTGVSDLTVNYDRLAPQPVDQLGFQADFAGFYEAGDGLLHFDRLNLSRGLVQLQLRGDIWLRRRALDLYADLPQTACGQILAAVPELLRPSLAKVKIGGALALALHLKLDASAPKETVLEADLKNQCRIEEPGNIPDPNFFRGPFVYYGYTEDGESLRLVTGPGTDRWAGISSISPYVIEALLTAEDGKFWEHKGMTVPELRRAIALNLEKKALLHGASTITMQLAKNLFLTRDRNVARKLQEIFFVWYLESYFAKQEILELYLNVVEFGPSLYGIRDAAMHYLGRDPSELTALESVFLIKLLPNPISRYKTYVHGGASKRQMAVYQRVLRSMKARNRLTETELSDALKQEIVFYKQGDPLPPPRTPIRGRGFLRSGSGGAGTEDLEDEEEESFW